MEEKKEQPKVMHKWRCRVCGYILVTELTKLPADYVCPVCGSPASAFDMIE